MTREENLAVYYHGLFLLEWDRIDRAQAVAEGLVTVSPDFSKGWILLSYLHDQTPKRALSYALRAFQLDKTNSQVALRYCDLEILYGDKKKALPIIEQLSQHQTIWGVRARLMRTRI